MKTQLQTIRNSITKAIGIGLLCLGSCLTTNAQTASQYSFSTATGTFTPLVGPTQSSLAVTTDDGISTAFNIGFNFVYEGIVYNNLKVSSNGYVVLGPNGTSSAANDLATGTTTLRPGFAPLWDDLQCIAGVSYQLSGTAPNRILTMEWLTMEWNYQSTTSVISFQVMLYETTNIIEYIYRQEATAYNAGTTGGASIGIMGASASQFISLQNTSASPTTSTTVAKNDITVKPATGQIYRFTPPPACTSPITQPTTLTFPSAFSTQLSLSYTAAAAPAPSAYLIVRYPTGSAVTNPTDGINYTAGQALGLGTVVALTTGTTAAVTGLLPSTSYDFYIYSTNTGACGTAYNIVSPLFATQSTSAPTSSITTATGGNWSAASTWVGGYIPTIYDTAFVASGATLIVDAAVTTAKLVLNNNSNVFLNANLLDSTDLVINSGATFNGYYGVTGRTLTLFGNITNNGTMNLNKPGAVLSMNGTLAQTIGGSGTFSVVPTLTINNSSGVALNSNLTVPVTLNLTKGILSGTGTLTLGNLAFNNTFTMNSNGGSVSSTVASGLAGLNAVTYSYGAPTPVAGYTTGNELTLTSPVQTVTFAAMAANYTLGTNATLNNVTFNDTLVVDAPLTLTVNGTASFGAATVVNGSGAFTMGPASSLTTSNLGGISMTGLTGSVQTSTRTYGTTSNYTYNGGTGQITGDGLPTTLTGGTVTISTTGGTTLTQGVTFNNLTLTAAFLSNSGTITVNGIGNLGTQAITGTGIFIAGPASRLLLSGVGTGYLVTTGANGNVQVTGGRSYNTGLDIVLGGTMTATGDDFPTFAIDSLVLNQTSAVTLTAPTTVNTLYITAGGRIATTPTNILTIAGTNSTNVARVSTGYIDGPLARTIAPNAPGSFLFPLGAGATTGLGLEIINPTVTGGNIVLTAIARSQSSAGTAGTGLTAINTNRYWAIAPVSGGGTLSSVGNIRAYESSVSTMGSGRKMGFTTVNSNGAYNSIGGQVDSVSVSVLSSQTVPAFGTGADSTFIVLGAGTSSGAFTAGTYSVGPTGNYRSLTGAIAAINENTSMTGPVVLEFQTTYNPNVETYPIVFKATLPTTASNTLTIRPSSGVSSAINFSGMTLVSPQGLFEFNGGKNIVIDGRPGGTGTNRYISITQRQVGTYPAVRFINDGQNVNLKWLTITANNASATSGIVIFSTTTGTTVNNGNSFDTLSFCNINGNSASANGVYVLGSASPAINRNCAVLNCNVYDLFTNGGTNVGVLLSTTGDSAWTINNNNFYQTAARTPFTVPALTASQTYIGIQVNNSAGGGFEINNNYIGANPAIPGAMFTYGDNSISTTQNHIVNGINLVVNSTVPSSVQGNTVANINLYSSNTSATNPFQGIFVSNGFVNMGNTTPNIIGATTGNSSINITYRGTSTGTCYGLRHAGVQGGIYNSSVGAVDLDITGTSSSGGTLAFVGLNTGNTYTSTLVIANNLVGSQTTANSIRGLATAAGIISIYGGQPNSHNGSPLNVTSNTIANISNFNSTPGSSVRGIVTGTGTSTSTTTFSNNIIRDLNNAAPNTNTNDAAAVVGMGSVTGSAVGTQVFIQNQIYNLVSSCTVPAAVNVIGIYYNSASTATYHTIEKNTIRAFQVPSSNYLAMQSGITLAGGSTRVAMSNNMIVLGIDTAGASNTGSQLITGINKTGGVASVFFNNIYIGGSGVVSNAVNTFAFRRTVTGADSIYNNIFMNARSNASGTGVNYAISLNNATTTLSNTNVLYAPGTGGKVGSFNGVDAATMSAWKVASGIDANSFSADPQFIAPTGNTAASNLHISTVTATPIEGTGTAIASVTTDFDNQTRSGFTPTDIGADAGNFTASDVIAPALTITPLTATASTSSVVLTATITDATGVSTTGSLRPAVYYKKSVLGTYFTATGTLSSGTATNGTWSFTINPTNVGGIAVGDTMFYFFAAEDVTALTSLATYPAGGSGTNVSAITTFPPTPYSYRVLNGISGTFHIGASQPATTITSKMTEIMGKLVDGDITLLLDADYSSASEPAFPIVLSQFASDISTRTITIKPNVGVVDTISANSATSIIKIDGGDNYIIDGSNTVNGTTRDMTILNTSTSSTGNAVVWIASASASNGALNNIVKNTNIRGDFAATPNVQMGIFMGATASISTTATALTPNSNNRFVNNSVGRVRFGLFAIGNSTTSPDNNTYIARNNFGAAVGNGDTIVFNAILLINQNADSIYKNTVRNVVSTTTTGLTITDVNGLVGGIYVRESKNSVIASNLVTRLWITAGGSTQRQYGIVSDAPSFNTVGNPSNNQIINNQVSKMVYVGSGSGWNIVGIGLHGGFGDKVYYNTVYLDSTFKGSTGPSCAYCNGTSSATANSLNSDVRNNIFAINGIGITGATGNTFAHYAQAANYTGATINNNILYSNITGGPTALLGSLNAATHSTLANWQTATTQEANSVNANPQVVSTSSEILIPSLGGPALSAGVSIAGITKDMIDSTRGGTPTIGAIETGRDVSAPTISYSSPGNDQNPISSRTLNGFATITDFSGVNITAGTKPRMYYKKKTDANAFVGNSSSDNGWKWVQATNTTSPFSFVVDYTIINGGFVANFDTIQYFVVAQDNIAPTPNVGSMQSAGFVGTSVSAITSAPTSPDYYIIINLPPLAGNYTVGVGQNYTTLTAAVNDLSLRGASDSVIFTLTDAAYGASETFPINLAAYSGASNINTVTIRPFAGINSVITGSAAAPAVFKLTNAKNYIIDGLNTGGSSLTLTSTNTGTSSVIWLASSGTGNKRIRILNTTLNGGSNGSTTSAGIAATLDGSASSGGADNDTILISGNTINKCFYGIYANGTAATSAGGLDAWTITDNIIGPVTSGANNIGFAGIWMNNALNVNISRDSIRNVVTSTTVTTGGAGVQLSNVNRAVVHQNTFRDISSTTTTSGVNSVSAINFTSNVINSRISRNTIRGIASTTTGGYGVKAVIINSSTTDTIINNVISDVWCFVDVDPIYWPVGIDIEGSAGSIKVYNNSVNIFGAHTGWASATGATGAAALYVSATGTGIDVRNNILACSYDNSNVTVDKCYAFYSGAAGTAYTNINYNNYYVYGLPGVLGYYGGAAQATLSAMQTATGMDGSSINDSTNFVSPFDLHITGTTVGNLAYMGQSFAALTEDIDGDARVVLYPYIGADESTSSPLPVELTSLTATVKGDDVQVDWSTASEVNNQGFEVERSVDGKTFSYVDFVKGAGNTSRTMNYTLTDADAFNKGGANVLYYRLKQVDFNGRFEYSQIVKVSQNAIEANALSVFPNPYSADFNVSFTANNAGNAEVKIVDLQGKTVALQSTVITNGNNLIPVSQAASLQSGIYFVHLTVNGETQVIKLVKN